MRRLLLALAVLGLCACGEAPPVPVAPPTAPPGNRHEWRASVVMNVISVDDAALTGIYSGGVSRFRLAEGAVVPKPLRAGETVSAACRMAASGAWVVLSVERHHGLPIAFGTVRARTAGSLVLETPFGTKPFTLNADSDVAGDVQVGAFADLKYYRLRGTATVLNGRAQPGCRVAEGILAARGPDSFSLRTLRGTIPFAAPAPDLEVGTPVTFRYRLDDADRVQPLSLEERAGPFRFLGKVTEHGDRTLSVIDVVDHTGDVVTFQAEEPLGDLHPGDLVQVSYDLPEAGLPPRLLGLEKRPLRPVYFGTVVSIDRERIRLVTRQGVTRDLRVTGATVVPAPIRPGDMADVIYRREGQGLPVATGIFKE